MWMRWLPWRYVVRKVAKARGFIDPIAVLARLRRFKQPAEVEEPIELLRAGVVFHARGLMNTVVIQNNLDWIWPYWVERQFDPRDESFIPRAFSITHVNLTHRNWTAVGQPDWDLLPIVDPRGLLTPFWDGWSIDSWLITDDGRRLVPSQMLDGVQRMDFGDDEGVTIRTTSTAGGLALDSRVGVLPGQPVPVCRQRLEARCDTDGWLVVSVRPYNPEGVSFVHAVSLDRDRRGWTVEGRQRVELGEPAERSGFSTFRAGDVSARLPGADDRTAIECEAGLVTAAALYRVTAGEPRRLNVTIPLSPPDAASVAATRHAPHPTWKQALERTCRMSVPDERIQFLHDAAIRTLVLHSPGDVYPGPYTYKRFWFRDAALILNAMLGAGMIERSERTLETFFPRQTRSGYFLSQEGEWDSNGEALWILHRYCELTGRAAPRSWLGPVKKGAQWIVRKRLPDDLREPHAGLLPAGFSAEHLGPNDFYYWDDYWGVAGLRAAASMVEMHGDDRIAAALRAEADRFMTAIERSLDATAPNRPIAGLPASPYRRMDAGAIGSIVGGYPLRLLPAQDKRLIATCDFFLDRCWVDGGFFQDMIHSGINAYLTLHVAQVLLRAGDSRYAAMIRAVADLASPTGQWPEAIHPRTHGGCMGDGQHVWAAAEWLLMLRSCFVLEEDGKLILGAGLLPEWLQPGSRMFFGPTPTPYGPITVRVDVDGDHVNVTWEGRWRAGAPVIEVRVPGGGGEPVDASAGRARVARGSR